MKIRFLLDTYIRQAPIITPDNILGIARRGTCVDVENTTLQGQSFRAIAHWYRDPNDNYFWAGATEQVEDDLDCISMNNPVNYLTFDPQRMNRFIREWKIIERFWSRGILGQEVNIAVLSTGIDPLFTDLDTRIRAGYDFCSSADRQDLTDECGTGTAIAGIIAGAGKGEAYGLAPKAGLYIGKIAKQPEEHKLGHLIDALYWALGLPVQLVYVDAQFRPDLVPVPERAALEQVIKKLTAKGILVIVPNSPGIEASSLQPLPAALENCLAVAAQEQLPGSYPGIFMGITAHGENITPLPYSTPHITASRVAAAAISGLFVLLGQELRRQTPDLPFIRIRELEHVLREQ